MDGPRSFITRELTHTPAVASSVRMRSQVCRGHGCLGGQLPGGLVALHPEPRWVSRQLPVSRSWAKACRCSFCLKHGDKGPVSKDL